MDKNKKITIIISSIIVLIIVITGILVYNSLSSKGKDNETVVNNKNLELAKDLYIDDVIAATKDYYYKNNLVDTENLEYWDVKKSDVVGYYKNNINVIYYAIEGVYKCIDGTSDCVYIAQDDSNSTTGEITFKVYAGINIDTEPYTLNNISSYLSKEGFIENKSNIVKEKETLEKNIISAFKDKMIELNLYTEKDIKELQINAQYETTLHGKNYYRVYGKYICVDGTSDCIYQSQVGDIKNGYYELSVYVYGNVSDDKYTINGIENYISKSEENFISGTKIFALQKEYYKNKGYVKEAELENWVLISAVYKSKDNGIYKYEVKSKFKCTSNEKECIYDPQLSDEGTDGYISISTIINFEQKDGEYKITSIE